MQLSHTNTVPFHILVVGFEIQVLSIGRRDHHAITKQIKYKDKSTREKRATAALSLSIAVCMYVCIPKHTCRASMKIFVYLMVVHIGLYIMY